VVRWFTIGPAVVAILFALSTVLSWGYYGEQAWTWLFGERKASRVAYRLFLCAVLSIAGTLDLRQIVNIVDSLNFAMAIPNLIAVYLFLPELRTDLASYWQRIVLGGGKKNDA
jgi:AGCS family alanine or glycine:cation symporter